MRGLQGKNAIVTGGAAGIGRAIALRLGKEGVSVGIIDLNEETYLLAWITTPWTLPSNLACAVGEDIDYCLISLNEENYIIANSVLQNYE